MTYLKDVKVDILKALIEEVKANPSIYDQRSLVEVDEHGCGTTYCIAGLCYLRYIFPEATPEIVDCRGYDAASKFLGLTKSQASYVFDCDRTLEEIEEFANGLCEGDGWEDE